MSKAKKTRKARGPRYHRVIVKASGENLGNKKGKGVNFKAVRKLAMMIKRLRDSGLEVAVVVGGGNLCRGEEAAAAGMDRVNADKMGMLATMMNALALQDALEQLGCETRMQTAIETNSVAEPYIQRRAIRHLQKGRIVIFAGGIGQPLLTTDHTVVQRGIEIKADVALVGKNGVDGVYTGNPKKDPTATKLNRVTHKKCLVKGYEVMDPTAFALAYTHRLPIMVHEAGNEQAMRAMLHGTRGVGTVVYTPKAA